MSDMQLSQALVESVQNAVVQHDPRAEASGVLIQYLSATIGFVLANENMPPEEKRDVLEQLNAFSLHVLEDVEGQTQSTPPSQEAFGVWRANQDN